MIPTLLKRITYNCSYVRDIDSFYNEILNKTVVPAQVEVQPGRINAKALCWMPCPYCYGGAATDDGTRLSPERYVEIIRQTARGPHGGIGKIIFAGYATDPLNYEHIEDIVDAALVNKQVVGFHTKLIKISPDLIGKLEGPLLQEKSYFSVSIDAGDAISYNRTHGLPDSAQTYNAVMENIRSLSGVNKRSKTKLDITANYLLTRANSDPRTVEKGIKKLIEAGVDVVRFSFPQVPRGFESENGSIIPNRSEIRAIFQSLQPMVASFAGGSASVVMLDFEEERGVSERRTLPCLARFIYPTIGFDGYLANCSQSSSTDFRDMALGNLAERDFWDAFYDYSTENFVAELRSRHELMIKNGCRCDRKEHMFNRLFCELLKDTIPGKDM